MRPSTLARRARAGHSLLEIVMFAAIGSMVLYIGYELFVGSAKQGRDLDTKLKAVQASQLLLERLERDLKHLVYEEGRYTLEVGEDGRRVRFYMFDGHGQDLTDGVIPIHLREYLFDPGSSRVMIDGEPYVSAYFRQVLFELGNAGSDPSRPRPVLTMRVGGVADERAGLPEDDLDLRTRADFVSSVGLSAIAAVERTPQWVTSLTYRVQ